MSYKVFLTGATGFVGQNLMPYLLDRKFSILAPKSAEWVRVLDFTGAEAIVHLAGKAHDLKKSANADEYYNVNFGLTKKLYDAFIHSDARIFIFVSSVKACADNINSILDEDASPNPQTHYGKSKLMAEQYIQSQSLPEGKSYYILRPCMIHGPGNKGNLNLLYKIIQKGIPYPLAAYENKRSFLSIENLCFIIKKLLEVGSLPSGIYNVADDNALSTNEVVAILAASMGKNPSLWHIPKPLLKGIAYICDYLKLPLNTERLDKLTENYIVSNKKLKAGLNVQLPIGSREGLMSTAKSFNKS